MNSIDSKTLWEDIWEKSIYSLIDKINVDKYVGVSFSTQLPHIEKIVPKGSKVLEAGCGMGQWVIYLDKIGYKTIGLDFTISALKECKCRFPNQNLISGNLLNMPFKKESFDSILSWGVVEHFIEGPQKVLAEMYHVLKPGGFLFITVPYKNVLYQSPFLKMTNFLIKNSFFRKLARKVKYEERFFEYSFHRKDFQIILEKAGYYTIFEFPVSHEVGFVRQINRHFYPLWKNTKFFYRSKTLRWDGLTKIGSAICVILKTISQWFTPDQLFVIAEKK